MSSASGTRRTIRLSIVALLPISIARTDVGWRRRPRLCGCRVGDRLPRQSRRYERRGSGGLAASAHEVRLWDL